MNAIPSALEAEYRRQYAQLPHRNITFRMFVNESEQKKREKHHWAGLFHQQIRNGCLKYEVDLETKPTAHSIPRTVVIDGANIMHCGSTDIDPRFPKNFSGEPAHVPDVLALLAVMRYFVINDFDVIAVISHKYQKEDSTNYCVAIRELISENLCTVSHNTTLDDVIALELAAHLNGVVITSDYYRDHREELDRYKSMFRMNWMGIAWETIGIDKNTITADGKHFMPNKRFIFKNHEKVVLDETAVKSKMFVDKRDPRYPISKERRDSVWTNDRKQEVLALLNRLIIEGIAVCPANVERVRQTPRSIPIADQIQGQNDSDDDDDW